MGKARLEAPNGRALGQGTASIAPEALPRSKRVAVDSGE